MTVDKGIEIFTTDSDSRSDSVVLGSTSQESINPKNASKSIEAQREWSAERVQTESVNRCSV